MRKHRSYTLIFGKPIIVPDSYFTAPLTRGNSPYTFIEAYYDEKSPSAYLIDQHEISFKVEKRIKGMNTAEITISNLHKDTISYLLLNKGKNLVIVLKAGYDGNNKILFQGTMEYCSVIKDNTTSKTKIIILDGKLNTTSAYTSRTYPAGMKVQSVVEDLLFDMAVPFGRVVKVPPAYTISNPLSFMGNTMDGLTRLLAGYEYTPTINDGMCSIVPDGASLKEEVAYISPDSGLLGSVQGLINTNTKTNKTEDPTTDKERIRFTCQLDASLNPMSSVYVKDDAMSINSSYKIENVIFLSSSFETGSWTATVDAVKTDVKVAL